MAFEDVLYEKRDGIAAITINRPKVLDAFRAETVAEMRDAESDPEIGVVVLEGRRGSGAFRDGPNHRVNFIVIPAKAGVHFSRGYRPAPR
jgi:1,4-dihydroxy-2-naphthoyl-CoA synthase